LERPAALQRRSDRLEVRPADDALNRAGTGADGVDVRAVHAEFALLRERSRQRRRRRDRGVLDRRFTLDALDDVEAELGRALRVHAGIGLLKILRSLQAEHVLEVEPGIDRVQPQQAARQEPGADQQHERRRQLTDDERALRAAPAAIAGRASADIARTGSFMNVSRGAHAKSIAIAVETPSVNTSTRASSPISPVRDVKREV